MDIFENFWNVYSKEINLDSVFFDSNSQNLEIIKNPGLVYTDLHSPILFLATTLNSLLLEIIDKEGEVEEEEIKDILYYSLEQGCVPEPLYLKYDITFNR